MGIAIPQVITPSKASGAQVIDGSLRFTENSSDFKYLTRTLGSGNRRTFTFSYWYRADTTQTGKRYISTGYNTSGAYGFYIGDNPEITFNDTGTGSANYDVRPTRKIRDNGWYHYVFNLDTTQATQADRVRIYVNGVRLTAFTNNTLPSQNADGGMNTSGRVLTLGAWELNGNITNQLQGQLAQLYHIDGQSLDASYFGFTDPLTNTWKPKKYTGTFTGTNTFYLPFDGKTPIGKDQSGNGNDFAPVNFGGSVELDSPLVSGARPILNTTQGGSQAAVGVFGSKQNVGYAVTVYNDGGGNKYYIDGVKQDTVTGLIRGATYTFDTSDSTVSSHPFRFSATSNGSHGGGSEYTNGVAAITGAATTITVPHDAPNTLYYYCTAHSGMGADITGITTNEKLADQYASSCILALPMLGDADVSVSVACTSSTKAVTNSGVTPEGISHFYATSSLFESSSDYLRLASSPFDYGNGDFTMEFWCYLTGAYTTARHIISAWQDGGNQTFYVGSGGANGYWASFGVKIGGTQYEVNGDVNKGRIPQNNWVHIAAVRDGTNLKLFVNGSLVGTTACTSGSMISLPTYVYIGKHYSASGYEWVGNLSDLRIYKGIAKYTEAFVPASTNPDILLDTPSGVSGGSKLTKITDGAVSFDGPTNGASVGTGYLTIPSSNSSDFNFGTGDFTWEAFVYCDDWTGGSSNDDQFVIAHAPSDNNNISGLFVDGGQSYYYSNKDSSRNIITGPVLDDKRWYHIAASRESGTLRFFVNGKSAGSASYTDSYADAIFTLGRNEDNNKNQFRGFISNFRVIKGTALYTKNFTPPTEPLTNITNTKLLCCQSNSSAVNYAVSPGTITANGDAVATNFNPFNTDINTVRGQETDYSTFNPLMNRGNNTLTNGKTFVTGGGNWNTTLCTGVIESGKWFVELTHRGRQSASDNDIQFGLFGLNNSEDGIPLASTKDLAAQSTGYVIVDAQAQWYNNSSSTSYGTTWSTPGDVVGLRYNADTGKLGFIINGFDQGDISSTLSTSQRWVVGISLRGGGAMAEINFGQKPFKFPPPDGFQLLNAASTRPVKVISRPDQYVGVATYTGSGNTSQDIILGFKPDFAWTKSRSTAENNGLFDSVRGLPKFLRSDSTDNEYTLAAGTPVSFISNGINFTNGSGEINESTRNYVVWAWKAGGNKNTFNVDDVGYATAAAAGLTGGDITPSGASVGTKQGFSIIQYAGTNNASTQTIPHGLSQKPDFMIVKQLTDNSTSWIIYHSSLGATKYLQFDATPAGTNSGPWGDTEPTSSLFTVGSGYNNTNRVSRNFISYHWHSVPGLQKFGTYEGNENTDGPFVELGFRPAMVMVRNVDETGNDWKIYDGTRNPTNVVTQVLYPNLSNTEDANTGLDFLSNGFKLRDNGSAQNGAETIIYAAWAEAPSIDLYGGGANAR